MMVFEKQKTEQAMGSVVVIILNDAGEILLTKRSIQPDFGKWVLPGGKVRTESPWEAAPREVYEETGLKVKIERLYGTYVDLTDPRGPFMQAAFAARVVGGEVMRTVEVSETGWFAPDKLPAPMGFNHADIIKDFKNSPNGQPVKN